MNNSNYSKSEVLQVETKGNITSQSFEYNTF